MITNKDIQSLGTFQTEVDPFLDAIASQLEVIQASIPCMDLESEEEGEEPWLDVRLRVFNGAFDRRAKNRNFEAIVKIRFFSCKTWNFCR